MTLLATRELSIGYRGASRRLLSGLDLTVGPGELVGVLGPNGAGKSTLLRTLAGLHPPLAGWVEIGGERIDRLPPRRRARRVAVVLPGQRRPHLLRIRDLVALGRQPYTPWSGRLSEADRETVERAIAAVGLEHLAPRPVDEVSDGEAQKATIARALAQEPRLLLLDEPTSFLDVRHRVELMGVLARLVARANRAVVVSLHDLELALRMTSRVWLLTPEGNLLDGAPEDLALSGAIAAAFPTDTATWDRVSGSFRPIVPTSGAVAFEGTGDAALWTERALARRGIGRSEGAAIRVGVAPGPAWWVERDGRRTGADSIGELLRLVEEEASRER